MQTYKLHGCSNLGPRLIETSVAPVLGETERGPEMSVRKRLYLVRLPSLRAQLGRIRMNHHEPKSLRCAEIMRRAGEVHNDVDEARALEDH